MLEKIRSSKPSPEGSWTMHHKLGVNWWHLILLVVLILVALFLGAWLIALIMKMISGLFATLANGISRISFQKEIKDNMEAYDYEEDEDAEEDYGHGHYENSSRYIIHDNYIIPNGNQHKNPYGKTNLQFLRELNDRIGIIKVLNGEPIFDKDGGTKNGKPLQIIFPEGIKGFLSECDLTKKKNIRRTKLHNEAYRRIAKKYAIEEDELQIFKGNSAPIERLMQKWNCSEDEVYLRCHNPYRINRVLHECKDGKTIQLVPWVYHHIKHDGGISEISSKY